MHYLRRNEVFLLFAIVTDKQEGESVETCHFFTAKRCKNKAQAIEQIQQDLILYNAFYNERKPTYTILTDKEWCEQYPKFLNTESLRNLGDTLWAFKHRKNKEKTLFEYSLPLEERMWTEEELNKMIRTIKTQ